MVTKKKEAKPREISLYFEDEATCIAARDALGESSRRPIDLDKKHVNGYSRTTGHYGHTYRDGNLYRVPIRFKLNINAGSLETLTWEQRNGLRVLAGDDADGWIVQ